MLSLYPSEGSIDSKTFVAGFVCVCVSVCARNRKAWGSLLTKVVI